MEIHLNNTQHLVDFVELNNQWIEHYFSLEPQDLALAANPKKVIDEGGYIFSVAINGKVAGVCALFAAEAGEYELARMAVAPEYQGRQIASKLMELSVTKAKALDARRIFLVSNTRLEAAIHLYKKFGFTVMREGQHPVYSRANIEMEYLLSD